MKKFICLLGLVIIAGTAAFTFAEEKKSADEKVEFHIYFESSQKELINEAFKEFTDGLEGTRFSFTLQENCCSFNNCTMEKRVYKSTNKSEEKIAEYKKMYLDMGYTEDELFIGEDKRSFSSDTIIVGVKQKYPYIYFEFSSEKADDNSSEEFDVDPREAGCFSTIDLHYTASENSETVDYYSNFWTASDEDKIDAVRMYLNAVVRKLDADKFTGQTEAPSYIDEISLTGKSNVTSSVSVAAFNDYSLAARNNNEVVRMNAAGEKLENLTEKLGAEIASSMTNYWVLKSTDGERVMFNSANSNVHDGKVYTFDKTGNFLQTFEYTFPAETYYNILFSKEGVPYVFCNGGLDKLTVSFATLDFSEPEKFQYTKGRTQSTTTGPDETVYVQHYSAIFVYERNGKLKDIIIPSTNYGDFTIPYVCDDLCFFTLNTILYKDYRLTKYSPDGYEIYSFMLPSGLNGFDFGDYRGGVIYAACFGKILRFAEQDAPVPEFLRKIGEYNSFIDMDSVLNSRCYLSLADVYLANGGYSLARKNLEKYLVRNPGDSYAQEKLLLVQVAADKKLASYYAENALALYDLYGVESGRSDYQEAMKLLEKLKKTVPGDTEVAELYAELKKTFSPESDVSSKVPDLEVVEVNLPVLFPALMNVYASSPSGYITVKNIGKTVLKNISVSSFLRKYMDFATSGSVIKELKCGEQCAVEVKTILNRNVLNVNEDSNVQIQFTLNWEQNGKKENVVLVRPVTLYKKTAMSWTDTAMLSCFIMPNDATVSAFAFKALEDSGAEAAAGIAGNAASGAGTERPVISKNFNRAMKLTDALGSIPLNYVPDPVTPVSSVMENEYAVDTVRFPKDTLFIKGGDCDDMTTLFCSVLESAGVPAALLTTPGHIFAAFNAGVKYTSLWDNIGSEYMALNYNDEVWIPIETTVLYEGFTGAWKTASKEISSVDILSDDFEFIPLAEKRSLYPPVSTDESAAVNVVLKNDKSILNASVKKEIVENIFVPSLEKQIAGCTKVSTLNSAAKLFYSLGKTERAIAVLNTAFSLDAKNVPVLNNLVALYKSVGDTKRADEILVRAKKIKEFQKAPVMVKSDFASGSADSSTGRAAEAEKEIPWME